VLLPSVLVLAVLLTLLTFRGALALSPAPAHAADLFAELRNFPGVVLVPSAALAPFSDLEPWRVELNRPRAGSTGPLRAAT